LAEADESVHPDEAAMMSELCAAAAGYGILLTNGSYVVAKGCGGMKMHQGTHLAVSEHAVLLALFVRVHGHKPADARAHLETTQNEEFAEALRWVDSNPALVEALRDEPATLEDGVFSIEPVRGVFARWLAGRKKSPALGDAAPAPSKRPARSAAETARLAEARALVEKALASTEE
jgi:hypothetical protein